MQLFTDASGTTISLPMHTSIRCPVTYVLTKRLRIIFVCMFRFSMDNGSFLFITLKYNTVTNAEGMNLKLLYGLKYTKNVISKFILSLKS